MVIRSRLNLTTNRYLTFLVRRRGYHLLRQLGFNVGLFLTLSAYNYTIRHKPGQSIGNADALSRLPRPVSTSSDSTPADLVLLMDHLSGTTCCAAHIKEWTAKDPILSQVYRYVMSG